MMGGNGDVRCGDCEHFSEEGCEEAVEALILDGWPRAAVCPDDSADASRCPEFSLAGGLAFDEGVGMDEEEERSARQARARVEAVRGFMSW